MFKQEDQGRNCDDVLMGEGESRMGSAGTKSLWSAWEWYQESLVKQPVRTQMITSGMLWSLGDIVAQLFTPGLHEPHERSRAPESSIGGDRLRGDVILTSTSRLDWRRVGTAGLFGAAFVGPTGHFWYQFLEYVCTKTLKYEPNSTRFVSTKLVADTFFFGPLHLLAFFLYMGLAAGKPFVQVKQDIHRDFMPTLLTEGIFWMCVQMANFRFVPVKHQLLFVNCFCLLDSAFLSWIKHSDNAAWKHWMAAPTSLKGDAN